MAQLLVNLGDNSYPITIATSLDNLVSTIAEQVKGRQVVVISNEIVAPLYLENLKKHLPSVSLFTYQMPDGEAYKSLNTFESVQSFLLENRISRDAVLLALGGGVVGDLCGFVAATYQRGVDFIQIPTTLLAQVDSSVGGKTAVNHPLGKNMIGAFYQPKSVLIATDTLNSLPAREFSAGFAEVVKYGIIYDAEFFEFLEANKAQIKQRDPEILAQVIYRCCEIKAEVVAKDEKESGIRALLNLGHTFGHAIEAEQGYGAWLHGEAVSAGMVIACDLAVMRGDMTEVEKQRVVELLTYFDLPVQGPATMKMEHYLAHMGRDKKVKAGKIRFIVPTALGKADIFADITDAELSALLD